MQGHHLLFDRFETQIHALSHGQDLPRAELLNGRFLLASEDPLEIHYAPFDYINRNAAIVIVGVTPGWSQMQLGFRHARLAMDSTDDPDQICLAAKKSAAFAGAMRSNLVRMLDALGIHERIGLASCGSLFEDARDLLHSTSAVRYPTFVRGRNYTGTKPDLLRSPLLLSYVEHTLGPELGELPHALTVALGQGADAAVRHLMTSGAVAERQILDLPHPSGANGHRERHFRERFERLGTVVRNWQPPAS